MIKQRSIFLAAAVMEENEIALNDILQSEKQTIMIFSFVIIKIQVFTSYPGTKI